MSVLSFEQKKAFHVTTQELLQQTQYPDIVNSLQELHKEKKMDKDSLQFVLIALFSIATEIRASQLGMEMSDIRFTPEEINKRQRENFLGGFFNTDS